MVCFPPFTNRRLEHPERVTYGAPGAGGLLESLASVGGAGDEAGSGSGAGEPEESEFEGSGSGEAEGEGGKSERGKGAGETEGEGVEPAGTKSGSLKRSKSGSEPVSESESSERVLAGSTQGTDSKFEAGAGTVPAGSPTEPGCTPDSGS
jgi:hypothetical protein